MVFDPHRTVFVILSLEGPDQYSQAGGLGVRVKGLSRTLAQLGYQTYLYFCGDPDLPAEESHESGRLSTGDGASGSPLAIAAASTTARRKRSAIGTRACPRASSTT